METKHTDGPWEIDPNGTVTARINGGNRAVAKVYPTAIGDARADHDRRLIATAPELLSELRAAHQIIRNALNLMDDAQKLQWAMRNGLDGCDGEGVTRANEREAVIRRATEEPA